MQLVKEDKYTEVEGIIKLNSLVDIIDLMISYYQSIFIMQDNWLAKREREFFIACVIISNKGLKYTSEESTKIYQEIFNLKRQSDVRGYLNDLEDKKFLKSNKKTKLIELPPFFDLNLEEERIKLNILLNYKNGKDKSDNGRYTGD
jgi:hypothetical protein